MNDFNLSDDSKFDIAIIGMAGKFPGAKNIDEYWNNLINGKECITFFSDEELDNEGLDKNILRDPNYVKAAPILDEPGMFDASFFGYSPREAQFIDPQQRLFLECSHEALENAGYNPEIFDGPIGIYGGTAMNTYFMFSGLMQNFMNEYLPTLIGADKDYIATRVAYKLNLRGPAITVQTACSSSLVAIHLACQSLLNEECDIALAGGAAVRVPHKAGHVYQEGSVFTIDGHCRPFDAKAGGTIFGSGVGIVALKRLTNAVSDGDNIIAVIKGSAVNNDGSSKIDYTAPSITSQAEVIAEALANSGVNADTIGYVEAHGTGTYLGDPIEISALTKAYRSYTDKKQFCAVGSVKGNIGHLDAGAGAAGIIKTALALKNGIIPQSINYDSPNPEINFEDSPFYVNNKLKKWERNGSPRRAAISSLGIGGTNAHIILEEPPVTKSSGAGREYQTFNFSAKSKSTLKKSLDNFIEYIKNNQKASLPDAAFTLNLGRREFNYRFSAAAKDYDELFSSLENYNSSSSNISGNKEVVFMFSGQGSQHINMCKDLYNSEKIFKNNFDYCTDKIKTEFNFDLKEIIFSESESKEKSELLKQTYITQPALFAIEYSLAKLWMDWGIKPAAMVGHSIGEYVAACIAGVISLDDAIRLVSLRGKLMQTLPKGSMTAVPLSENEVKKYLNEKLSISVINNPGMTVVSGEDDAISELENKLIQNGVECRKIHTSHAFHSFMMDPILDEFTSKVKKIKLNPPKIPYVSNVTGTWIKNSEAIDPAYYSKHIRSTVRFSENLRTLFSEPDRIFLEVGPGQALSSLSKQHPDRQKSQSIISSARHPKEHISDLKYMISSLGELWSAGAKIDWDSFYKNEDRGRIPLPTYPFERKNFWLKAENKNSISYKLSDEIKLKPEDWFYVPSWQLNFDLSKLEKSDKQIIVCCNDEDIVSNFLEKSFSCIKSDESELIKSLESIDEEIVFINLNLMSQLNYDTFLKEYKFLIKASQILGSKKSKIKIIIVGSNMAAVTEDELISPFNYALIGTCRVIQQEFPNIEFMAIDIKKNRLKNLDNLLSLADIKSEIVAVRGNQHWVQNYENIKVKTAEKNIIKNDDTFLITGGTGRLGFWLCDYLSSKANVNLILFSRTKYPAKEEWEEKKNNSVINRLRDMEKRGSKVRLFSCDISSDIEIAENIKIIKKNFKKINGVFHAAGNVNENDLVPILEKSAENIAKHFEPKIIGIENIQKNLEEFKPDFYFLFSSVSSQLGGLGHSAYSASNRYLDAFAYNYAEHSEKWISINWDRWNLDNSSEIGINSDEGKEIMDKILSNISNFKQLIVSCTDLNSRIDKWVRKQEVPATVAIDEEAIEDEDIIPPETETEKIVEKVWSELLGLKRTDIHSHFNDLGGHSLLATQIVSRLRSYFKIELSIKALFDNPTISKLSKHIDSERNDDLQINEMLKKVEKMSPNDLKKFAEKLKKS